MQPCRDIAQAVSRLLPTAAARVRARVRSCGICGGPSGIGADILLVLRFPLPVLIPSTAPHSSSSISSGADTIGQLVAGVPSGLSLTPPQETSSYCETHTEHKHSLRVECRVLVLK
jgi:hypothetical protein